MSTIFRGVVAHPVAVSMMFLAALVFGFVGFQRLPVELMPDISYPTITVRTGYSGAAPQEVESQISRPIEEALATLDGLVSIESRSRAGNSDVVLGFDWGTDMSGASQTIRENLQTLWLPTQADRPLILRYDPSLDPFLRVALSVDPDDEAAPEGEQALFLLREVAEDELKRELEGMRGVAAVRVQGGLEREIRVEVREDWLAARQVTLEAVQQALASENVNISGGSIIEGDVEYLIRTLNQYSGLADLQEIRVRRSDGVLVPITDLAILKETSSERQLMSRLDEGEAVQLEIFKEAGTNIVEVARRVKTTLRGDGTPEEWGGNPGLEDSLPAGMRLQILDDQAAFIELAVGNLGNTAIVGGVFAVMVLFLFLRDFRATAIIGVAIPVSIVIGFAPLYLLGVSLNLMSLGGLALGVGMLVDNAVVVLESIQRYREEGHGRVDASVLGVADVASAVTASTLTTVAVFFPIAFVEGVAGELFGDLSLAVVASLVASLAVALFAVPTLAALELPDLTAVDADGGPVALVRRRSDETRRAWLGRAWHEVRDAPTAGWRGARARHGRWTRWLWLPLDLFRIVLHGLGRSTIVGSVVVVGWMARLSRRVGTAVVRPLGGLALMAAGTFQRRYDRVAERYQRHLRSALAQPGRVLGLSALLFGLALGTGRWLGTELIPELHQARFTVELALPVGTPLPRTAAVVSEAERWVLEHPDVTTVYSTIGSDARADARSDEGQHTARLRVQLRDAADRAALESRVMGELRERLSELPRVESKMVRPALFSFRTPVEVVLYGWNLDQLRVVGDQVATALGDEPGFVDVRSSLVSGHPEVRIQYDRARLHRLGLDPATVAGRVRDKVQGVEATQIHRGDQRVSLLVQLIEPDRSTVDDLKRINVNPNLRPAIPLSAVADFEEAVGPSEIRRVDQQRAVVVSANLEAFDLGTAGDNIEAALLALSLPPEITWEVAGQSKEMQQSLGSLQFALGLAVFLVYVIMASTFESLVHPFVILFSVPLAAMGAVAGLFLFGHSLSVVVFIGLIVLAGVVVNNAIVLVDTINRQRSDGLGLDAAIRRAGALRVRPILITTATTVLGLLPLAFGWGAGAEMQGPLAVTVIGGLLSSTVLTLLVIPVVYRVVSGGEATAETSSAADCEPA